MFFQRFTEQNKNRPTVSVFAMCIESQRPELEGLEQTKPSLLHPAHDDCGWRGRGCLECPEIYLRSWKTVHPRRALCTSDPLTALQRENKSCEQ